MGGQSQQVMLDSFFAHLSGSSDWRRVVSDRAFCKARDRFNPASLSGLNSFLAERSDALRLVPRWHGLRVVAADASVLMPAVRPCHMLRRGASPDQRLFSLYLPSAEFTLHASVHGAEVSERQMLFEALDLLGPDDVLVLDRGYPAAWLVAYLNEKNIRFCMRCDKANGWRAVRAFMDSSDLPEATVTLHAPDAQDTLDYGCSGAAPQVRLVRQISPNGQIRVLVTNLPATEFPCAVFADLYHQRWRIEEAFKRLKHRAKLECVCGLTQHALLVDVAAKVLADNLVSLVCQAAVPELDDDVANVQNGVTRVTRHCNRAYAAPLMRTMLARMVLGLGCLASLLDTAMQLLRANTQRRISGRSKPRPSRHVKPHPHLAYKG
jgi:hypothetical protein